MMKHMEVVAGQQTLEKTGPESKSEVEGLRRALKLATPKSPGGRGTMESLREVRRLVVELMAS
jgi:hypothetical protein